jgi:fructosamine-3-kinase
MLPQFWESFGHKLAIMHRNTHTAFGGVPSNYLGTLAQPNPDTPTWQDFFAAWRLLPTARLALNKGLLNASEFAQVERACIRIAEICPNEPPSLVHGDLWKGNYLIGPEGQPCLIDPALHYGHREAELAMTLLFGGFDSQFYAAYQNEWPLVKGFQSRFQFYNLYPLLVHLVLFGSGYHFAVRSILDEFGS